jgi:hypothetical protein
LAVSFACSVLISGNAEWKMPRLKAEFCWINDNSKECTPPSNGAVQAVQNYDYLRDKDWKLYCYNLNGEYDCTEEVLKSAPEYLVWKDGNKLYVKLTKEARYWSDDINIIVEIGWKWYHIYVWGGSKFSVDVYNNNNK